MRAHEIGQLAALLLLRRKLPPRVVLRRLIERFPDLPVSRVAFEYLEIINAYRTNFTAAQGPEATMVADGFEALAVLHADLYLLHTIGTPDPTCGDVAAVWDQGEQFFVREPQAHDPAGRLAHFTGQD